MPIEGTSRLTRVQLAKLSLDFTRTTPEIKALIAMMDPVSGTSAFIQHNGSIWSQETQAALRQLVDCLERDAASTLLSDVANGVEKPAAATRGATQAAGIGELLAGGDTAPGDVPDM